MAPPPTTIVPLSVVIAEDRILLAAKRVAPEVIIDRKIAPTIKREVSLAIDRQAVARTKLGSITIAINIEVSCPINREVPVPIDRQVVARTKLGSSVITINIEVSRPIDREVSVAIDGNVPPRAKISIAREVSLVKRAHPSVLIDHPVWVCARRHVSPLPNWRGRSITMRARHCAGVCRPCRPNIRCSLRLRSIRPSVVVWLTPRCERQREASDAY